MTETGFVWSEFIRPPSTADDPKFRARFAGFTEALATGVYPEAEIAAKQMVEDSVVAGLGSPQHIKALHNLAVAQHVRGDYDAALQNYAASIELIAESDNNLSSDLILPLRGLSAALLVSGRPDDAGAALERAQHVSHVNFGPHSFDQLPILRSKMAFYMAEGDNDAALDVLDSIFTLYKRRYERNSEEMLPALYERADVFRRLRMHWEERMAWEHILDVKQAHVPDNDLELIEPNVRLAHIMMRGMRKDAFRSVTASDAEKHMRRALRIARESPNQDWAVTSECLLSLADFYTVFDMKGRARRYYTQAWELLSSDEEYRAEREKRFASPVPLVRPEPGAIVRVPYTPENGTGPRGQVLDGEITLGFVVDDRGRTRDVRLLTADPADFPEVEGRAIKAVEGFIFRPRYVDGLPVRTADQRFRFRFRYLDTEREPQAERPGQAAQRR